ncbi:MAG: repeat-containing protein, partial [Bacteroidetes bacterium]|nr:repeat-containing protein [Bacteroidota bacterium]
MKKSFFYIVFFFLTLKMFSTHIIGGELLYDKLDDSTYRITLKVYRDCFGGIPPFDGVDNGTGPVTPAVITVYQGLNLVGVYNIGTPTITNIPATLNNPCIQTPGGVCVEEGLYTYTLVLPPTAGGYDIIYQRCCRNGTVLNLVGPSSYGATYNTFIPGPEDAPVNSSPRFAGFPPIFICNNVPFTYDHKATDPDGDQLVYSLCAPYMGLDQQCGYVAAPGCPIAASPPPYTPVTFLSPYSGSNPIAGNPAFSINSSTGLLAGTPTLSGQYVFCVCVNEIRNGQVINTHFRDFQITVVNCTVQVLAAVANQTQQCQGMTLNFNNQSQNQSATPQYVWDFGVPSINSDTSTLFNPSYTYPDTGTYVISLVVNPGKPCTDTLKQTVYVYPTMKVALKPQDPQCLFNNSFSFNATGTFVPQATFQWTFTGATPSVANVANPTGIVYPAAGKYPVKLLGKQFVCRDSLVDTVRVIPRPVAKINNLPSSLCDPATVAFSNGSASELPLRYEWFFSNGTSSQQFQPSQVFSPSGVYSATLVAYTTSVCVDSSMATVSNLTVHLTPKAGFTFSPQTTTIFDPQINITNKASWDVSVWSYNFGDGAYSGITNDVHLYKEPGDYVITQIVSNPFGCSDTMIQTVKILPEFRFWIPNTFTPDENLLNDHFMPIAIGVVNYEFSVFTRWGERIFSTENPLEGWNGFYKGLECQQDVYVWKVVFKNVVTTKDEIHAG